MDQLGMNQVPQVQFGNNLPKAQEVQETTTSPYECKEDGDKKLIRALVGTGIIAAAGIMTFNHLRKGRLSIDDLKKAGIGFEDLGSGKVKMKKVDGKIVDASGTVIADKTIKKRFGKASMTIKDGQIVETVSPAKKGFVTKKFEYGMPEGAPEGSKKVLKKVTIDGKDTVFEHNTAGKIVSQTTPDGKKMQFVYDDSGKLTKTIKDGKEITYTFDDKGRLATKTYDGKKDTYTYDAEGKRTVKTEEVKPAEAPVAEAPVDTPAEIAEAGKGAPVAEAPADTPAEIAEAGKGAPVAEAPAEVPADTPAEVAEAKKGAPVAEAPAKADAAQALADLRKTIVTDEGNVRQRVAFLEQSKKVDFATRQDILGTLYDKDRLTEALEQLDKTHFGILDDDALASLYEYTKTDTAIQIIEELKKLDPQKVKSKNPGICIKQLGLGLAEPEGSKGKKEFAEFLASLV